MVQNEPPSNEIQAIFFGLFTSASESGTFPQLYVMGSTEFDEDDSDWACPDDESWEPEGRYFNLPELKALNADDYDAVEGHCRNLLLSCQPEICQMLGSSEGRPIALGFDDGDVAVLYKAA